MSRSSITVLALLPILTAAVLLAGRRPTAPLPSGTGPRAGADAAEEVPGAAEEPSRDPVRAADGCWSAPRGSFFRFRLRDHIAMAMRAPDGAAQTSSEQRAACTVTTTVLDRRAGEALLRQQIDDLSFADAGPAEQGLIAAARSPVLVRMRADGRILGYGFTDGLDGDQRNLLRGLLSCFDVEAPREAGAVWDGAIDDATGTCAVRYESLPADGARAAVRRTRVRYTAIGVTGEVPAHEVSGAAQAWFDAELGWLAAVRLDERLDMTLPWCGLRASSHRVAELELIDAGTAAVDGDLAAAWARASAPATGRFEPAASAADDDHRRVWEQRLRGVTLEALLLDLQQLGAAAPADREALAARFQDLRWMIALDDAAARELQMRIATRQLDEAASRAALGALGAAGTPAAQRALAELRADAGLAPALREAATVACLQLAAPEPQLVAGLCADAAGSGELRATAMLVLGALAPRASALRVSERSPFEALQAMEAQAEARGELDTWVLAMGNTRAAAALPIAQRLLAHPLPAVRGACCVALRQNASPDAVTALIERALADLDARVRHEAVAALARIPAPAARAALERAAQSDPDAGVRGRASRLLAQGG
jgi:hypothetical protein